jgi:excisionase family DNA binding protein
LLLHGRVFAKDTPISIKKEEPMSVTRLSYSPKQLADKLGVSVQTVQRWTDAGQVKAWKTPGGHRKIDAASADALIQSMRAAGGDEASKHSGNEPRDGFPSILLVDDDLAALEIVGLLVEEVYPDALVGTARNGFQALEAIGRATPDILITDIVMPHIDGLEMLRHVAGRAGRPSLIIATSVLAHEEVERMGGLPSGVVFMHKPLAPDALVGLLRSHRAKEEHRAK